MHLEARRGSCIPWSWSYLFAGCPACYVGVENCGHYDCAATPFTTSPALRIIRVILASVFFLISFTLDEYPAVCVFCQVAFR